MLLALLTVLLLAFTNSTSAAVGTTFTVDTVDGTTDGVCGGASDCSLGDAITAANAPPNPGKDTIAFAIPGAGPHVIVVGPPSFSDPHLPWITDAVVIDGFSQGGSGYTGTPLVEIDFTSQNQFAFRVSGEASAGTEFRGLAIYAPSGCCIRAIAFINPGGNIVEHNHIGLDATGSLVKGSGSILMQPICCPTPTTGNVIADNVLAQVQLANAAQSQVLRNTIGTDSSGQIQLSPAADGVIVSGGGNVIADNVVARRNIGIHIDGFSGQPSPGNRIEGNKIGTDATGEIDLGNAIGILNAEAVGTVIGGTSPTHRNLVSGNGRGIVLTRVASGLGDGVVVQGNYIGTDGDGDVALGNDEVGVSALSHHAVIAGNVISASGNPGLANLVASGEDVHIKANFIGTDRTGTVALPNGGRGISGALTNSVIGGANVVDGNVVSGNQRGGISLSGSGNLVRNNLVGTNASGDGALGNGDDGILLFTTDSVVEGNRSTWNTGAGVAVSLGGVRNRITGNAIFSNTGLGIDLGNNGAVAPNDAGDADGGANFQQNFPVLTSASGSIVDGTLNSVANRTYTIEFFGNAACDSPSGFGEGEQFLDAIVVTTNAVGNATFSAQLDVAAAPGSFVTATATDSDGNTSEFSRCAGVPPDGQIVVYKETLPEGDPQTFCFRASYDSDGFCLGDGQSNDSGLLVQGVYSVSEESVSGWNQAVTCSDGSGAASIQLAAGETVRCTFTNTKRAGVMLKKTTNGVVDPSKDITFVLTPINPAGPSITRSTFGDQDGELEWPNLVPGQYRVCESPVPAAFTSFWRLDGAIVTPYNPDASKSPPEDLGNRCYDFTISPGQTRAFEVDNSRPGGDPRTIGYWKNWNRCTGGNQSATAQKNGGAAAGFFLVEDLLPQTIGDFSVTSCQQAVKLLSKQDQNGRSKSSDTAYELGAQLLAARFNLAAGAETCLPVQQAVLDGQTLLDQINFTGAGDYLGSKSKDPRRAQALGLAATLDGYNNGNLC